MNTPCSLSQLCKTIDTSTVLKQLVMKHLSIEKTGIKKKGKCIICYTVKLDVLLVQNTFSELLDYLYY